MTGNSTCFEVGWRTPFPGQEELAAGPVVEGARGHLLKGLTELAVTPILEGIREVIKIKKSLNMGIARIG